MSYRSNYCYKIITTMKILSKAIYGILIQNKSNIIDKFMAVFVKGISQNNSLNKILSISVHIVFIGFICLTICLYFLDCHIFATPIKDRDDKECKKQEFWSMRLKTRNSFSHFETQDRKKGFFVFVSHAPQRHLPTSRAKSNLGSLLETVSRLKVRTVPFCTGLLWTIVKH